MDDTTTLDAAIDIWLTDTPLLNVTDKTRAAADTFFNVTLGNPNTRRAYFQAARGFFTIVSADQDITNLDHITSTMVRSYVDSQLNHKAKDIAATKTRTLTLTALRQLFGRLVVAGACTTNPCADVRKAKTTKPPKRANTLKVEELRRLIDSIPCLSQLDLRDRALIAFLAFTACRVGAAIKLTHGSFHAAHGREHVHLSEKGGKPHVMPILDDLAVELARYRNCLPDQDKVAPFFRRWSHAKKALTCHPMSYISAYRVVIARAHAAKIKTRISPHSFRATAITLFIDAGGSIEIARKIANHASADTTRLYDRKQRDVTNEDANLLARALAK